MTCRPRARAPPTPRAPPRSRRRRRHFAVSQSLVDGGRDGSMSCRGCAGDQNAPKNSRRVAVVTRGARETTRPFWWLQTRILRTLRHVAQRAPARKRSQARSGRTAASTASGSLPRRRSGLVGCSVSSSLPHVRRTPATGPHSSTSLDNLATFFLLDRAWHALLPRHRHRASRSRYARHARRTPAPAVPASFALAPQPARP